LTSAVKKIIQALKRWSEMIGVHVKILLKGRDVLIPGIDTGESHVVITIRQTIAELRDAEEAIHEVDPHHQEAAFLRLACAREQLNNLFVEAKTEGVRAKFIYTCKGKENSKSYLYC